MYLLAEDPEKTRPSPDILCYRLEVRNDASQRLVSSKGDPEIGRIRNRISCCSGDYQGSLARFWAPIVQQVAFRSVDLDPKIVTPNLHGVDFLLQDVLDCSFRWCVGPDDGIVHEYVGFSLRNWDSVDVDQP